MKNLFLLGGLPRSGSTLLMRILSQNPKIYSSPTSPLIDILIDTRNNWTQYLENRALNHTNIPKTTLTKVLKAMVKAYYDIPQEIVIDKSRSHASNIEIWKSLLDHPVKLIVPVRDLPDIISSMEKLHRKTSLVRQPPFEKEFHYQMQNIEGRAAVWTLPEQIIGLAYNRISDAIIRHPECLHFVHYDKLTKFPEETMLKIYRFLGETPFKHDFNNVPTLNIENDDINGYEDLHETRPKVEYRPSDARKILGDQIVDKYEQYNFSTIYPQLS